MRVLAGPTVSRIVAAARPPVRVVVDRRVSKTIFGKRFRVCFSAAVCSGKFRTTQMRSTKNTVSGRKHRKRNGRAVPLKGLPGLEGTVILEENLFQIIPKPIVIISIWLRQRLIITGIEDSNDV